jgi:hypothetical protein
MTWLGDLFGQGGDRAEDALRRIALRLEATIAGEAMVIDDARVSLRAAGRMMLVVAPTVLTDGAVIRIVPGAAGARVDGNDGALVDAWIDREIERAIGRAKGARASVADGEVAIEPGDDGDRALTAAIRLAAALATRPSRLGRALAAAADALDGRASAIAWGLDGELALAFTRPAGDVAIDYVRRLSRKESHRPALRTRARVPAGGIESNEQLAARVRQLAGLARAVGASSYALDAGAIELLVDGLIADRDRLAALVELAARLPGDVVQQGPYR